MSKIKTDIEATLSRSKEGLDLRKLFSLQVFQKQLEGAMELLIMVHISFKQLRFR